MSNSPMANEKLFKNMTAVDYLSLPSALSLRLWVAFFPIACINPLFIDHKSIGGSFAGWLLLLLQAHLILGAIFWIARQLLARMNSRSSRNAIVATAFIVGQILRGSFIGYETVQRHWTDDMLLFYRVTLGSFVYLLILTLFAVVLGAYDSHASLIKALQTNEAELLSRQISLEKDIEAIESDVKMQVMDTLTPHLNIIRERMLKDTGPTELLETVTLLQEFNDQVLHSLANNLISDNSFAELPSPHMGEFHKHPRDWRTTIQLDCALYPRIGFGLLFFINVGAAARIMSTNQFERFTSWYALLIGIPIFMMRYVVRGKNLTAFSATLILTFFYAVLSPSAFLILQYVHIEVPKKLMYPELVIGAVIGYVLVSYNVSTRERDLEIEKLTAIDVALNRNLVLLRQHRWLVRRRFAKVLHGRVQSIVVASTLNLASSKKSTQLVLSELEDSLLEGLSSDLNPVSIRLQLQELAGVWHNLIKVTYELPTDLEQLLKRDKAATECVAEVICEAVNNAKKHGHCTEVTIQLNTHSDNVRVQVNDDGSGPGIASEPGLGTEILNEICSEWSLTQNQVGQTEFVAKIPLRRTN